MYVYILERKVIKILHLFKIHGNLLVRPIVLTARIVDGFNVHFTFRAANVFLTSSLATCISFLDSARRPKLHCRISPPFRISNKPSAKKKTLMNAAMANTHLTQRLPRGKMAVSIPAAYSIRSWPCRLLDGCPSKIQPCTCSERDTWSTRCT